MEKLIITCAISGAEVTKNDNPYVPYTAKEMAIEAYLAAQAGASIIHLHVREDDGTPTQDVNRFQQVIKEIRKLCPKVIIQPSTGGAVGMSNDERLQPVSLKPEMCTLDCGSVNFGGNEVFINSENDIIYFAEKIYENNVLPELECFGKMHVDQVMRLYKKGLIKGHLHFSFVLGVPGGMTGEERDFHFLRESIPESATYSVAGIGRYEFSLAKLAIEHGGHVRVGLEDNLYLEKGKLAQGNKELVEKVANMARSLGRDVASPDEARRILGIKVL